MCVAPHGSYLTLSPLHDFELCRVVIGRWDLQSYYAPEGVTEDSVTLIVDGKRVADSTDVLCAVRISRYCTVHYAASRGE